MKSPICDLLGIEFPLVAFTHCRDVVCEVSKAGGMGVLGAAGFGPEQLESPDSGVPHAEAQHQSGVLLLGGQALKK